MKDWEGTAYSARGIHGVATAARGFGANVTNLGWRGALNVAAKNTAMRTMAVTPELAGLAGETTFINTAVGVRFSIGGMTLVHGDTALKVGAKFADEIASEFSKVDSRLLSKAFMSSNTRFVGTVDDSFVNLSQSEKYGLAIGAIEKSFGKSYAQKADELFNSVRSGWFNGAEDLGFFRASGKKAMIQLNEDIGNADVLALTILHETRHLRQFNKLMNKVEAGFIDGNKAKQIRAYNKAKVVWGVEYTNKEKEIFATSTNLWQGKRLGLNEEDLNIFKSYYKFFRE